MLSARPNPEAQKLDHRIPKDLETICLKCLQKEPDKRYASCREFAEDLGRWLRDEPIAARPIRQAEALWRWCRRNPAIAALSASAVVLLTITAAVACIGYEITSHALEKAQKGKARALAAEASAVTAQQLAEDEKSKAEVSIRTPKIRAKAAKASEDKAQSNEQEAIQEREHAQTEKRNAEEKRRRNWLGRTRSSPKRWPQNLRRTKTPGSDWPNTTSKATPRFSTRGTPIAGIFLCSRAGQLSSRPRRKWTCLGRCSGTG